MNFSFVKVSHPQRIEIFPKNAHKIVEKPQKCLINSSLNQRQSKSNELISIERKSIIILQNIVQMNPIDPIRRAPF